MKPRAPCSGSSPASKMNPQKAHDAHELLVLIVVFLLFLAAAQAPDRLPRPDGTVNLGPPPGEKGVWEINYIENMADFMVSGRRAKPQVPFLPWAEAVFDYHTANQAKYDPEGYCLPPGGPRLFTAPYPMEIIQLPD